LPRIKLQGDVVDLLIELLWLMLKISDLFFEGCDFLIALC
jgi:hypothetical protein